MKNNTRILTLVFVVAFLTLLVGCFPKTTPPIAENRAPSIVSDPVTTAKIGVEYIYNVGATDPDEDSLTYFLTTKPEGMTINSATGVISWKPKCGQAGDNLVIVEVSDGALSDTQIFIIKVGTSPAPPVPPVNHAPIITSIPGDTAIVGIEYTYTIKATDQDGDTLTYSFVSGPVGMIFDSIATIKWTPAEGQIGYNDVKVQVSDGKKATSQNFTIIVEAVELIRIEVEPDEVTLKTDSLTGITQQLEVTAYYNNGTDLVITSDCIYVSSNEDVATVSDVGRITGKKEVCGLVTITVIYTPDGVVFTDTVEVEVIVPVVIDGTLNLGEWDCSYLGTSETSWQGGMSVDVYGYADDTYLYVAYLADMTQPGWSVAASLGIGPNFDYWTPSSANWPEAGFTHISVGGDGFAQTDGSDWVWPDGWGNTVSSVFTNRGIEYYIGDPMWNTLPNPNVAELKIPLILLAYAGDDGQIGLSGQYWQYDFAEVFYVELP